MCNKELYSRVDGNLKQTAICLLPLCVSLQYATLCKQVYATMVVRTPHASGFWSTSLPDFQVLSVQNDIARFFLNLCHGTERARYESTPKMLLLQEVGKQV